jgi:hypothetical protein
VIGLPVTRRRAGAPARVTALSDCLFSLTPRPCAGEAAVTFHKSMLRAGTTDPGRTHRIGVTSDGAENPPRLRVTNGEDSQESEPPVKRRASTHTASTQDSPAPVPWRWRSRAARIRGLQGTSPQTGGSAHRCDLRPWFPSVRTLSPQRLTCLTPRGPSLTCGPTAHRLVRRVVHPAPNHGASCLRGPAAAAGSGVG